MARRYLDDRTGAHPYDLDEAARPPHTIYITVDMIPREAWDPESPMREHLRTPNLDRLMRDGTLFTHACTTSPLCGPSRASTLTGRYTYLLVNEERAHDGMAVALRDDDAIFPEYLRKSGWVTKHVGKCHVGAHKFIDAFGESDDAWNRWAPPLTDDDGYLRYLREMGVRPPRWRDPVTGQRPGGDPGNSYGGWVEQADGAELPEEATYCQYLAWLAGENLDSALLQREDDAPIYLQLDFFAPHQPFMVPGSYQERARELAQHIELPGSYHRAIAGEVQGLPRVYEFYLRNWGLYDEEIARQYMLMNFLQIEALDAATGRFLDALDRRGLYDESLIIFAGDHGEMNCELGLIDKGVYGHPKVALVPLVVKLPGGERAGTRVEALVSLLDIAPTILRVAGVEPADRLDGESLLPLVRGEREQRAGPFIFEAGWHVCPNPAVAWFARLDDRRLMYTYNLTSEFDELYDLDDRSYRNLAQDETMSAEKVEMIRALAAFLQSDARWTCYWHTFRLDKYELLELAGGDFQMFRPGR
ncbi:MAG: sulfatase-like hydrolase/transferase [Armatimonadota bacterium]